jgi:hypothetical protein
MNRYAITLDIDWAPEWAIDFVANVMIEEQVKATWFVTHDSPAVRKLQSYKKFEIGLHPNFRQGTTQGTTPQGIMTYLTTAFPDCRIVRTHGLVQSTELLAFLVNDFGIEVDVSLLLVNTPDIVPHRIYFAKGKKPLVRVPFFWEDDIEGNQPHPSWSLESPRYCCNGLKIFNFHPLHIVLNSADNRNYKRLKKQKKIQELTLSEIESYIHSGNGVGKLFKDLVQHISQREGGGLKISEIVQDWRRGGVDFHTALGEVRRNNG